MPRASRLNPSSKHSRIAKAAVAVAPRRRRAIFLEMLAGDLVEAKSPTQRGNVYYQFLRSSIAVRWDSLPWLLRWTTFTVVLLFASGLANLYSWLLSDVVSALGLALLWHYFDLRKTWARRLVAVATIHLIGFGATSLIQYLRLTAFFYHLHNAGMEKQYAQISLPFFVGQLVTLALAVWFIAMAIRHREFREFELFALLSLSVVVFCVAGDLSQSEYALRLISSQVAGLSTARPYFQGHELRWLKVDSVLAAVFLVIRAARLWREAKGSQLKRIEAN